MADVERRAKGRLWSSFADAWLGVTDDVGVVLSCTVNSPLLCEDVFGVGDAAEEEVVFLFNESERCRNVTSDFFRLS